MDQIDRSILRILSAHNRVTLVQLWYELGEDDSVKRRLTAKEMPGTLESLKGKGFVDRITGTEVSDDTRLSIYRAKTGVNAEESLREDLSHD